MDVALLKWWFHDLNEADEFYEAKHLKHVSTFSDSFPVVSYISL